MTRRKKLWTAAIVAVAAAFMAAPFACGPAAYAGTPAPEYRVLAPITQDNLTIFPVVAAPGATHDTSAFITLDEGLRSGEVVVTESGSQGLIRGPRPVPDRRGGADVNRLVLINNSKKPLILIAGEIVTGGKQDRVVGKDRIVPALSDPIDLSVFCVEPGRWTGRSSQFDAKATPMAQPSVRRQVMANRDQGQVWAEVRKAQDAFSAKLGGSAGMRGDYVGDLPAEHRMPATSSYAGTVNAPAVAMQVDTVAQPIERSYQDLIRRLRAQNAVGVVVAVDGQIIWADVFANTDLLEKYWPKLARSYAAEAVTHGSGGKPPSQADAQRFLDEVGGHELAESDPGIFRTTEVSGQGYRAFVLTSLLPKTGFDVHFSKMAL